MRETRHVADIKWDSIEDLERSNKLVFNRQTTPAYWKGRGIEKMIWESIPTICEADMKEDSEEQIAYEIMKSIGQAQKKRKLTQEEEELFEFCRGVMNRGMVRELIKRGYENGKLTQEEVHKLIGYSEEVNLYKINEIDALLEKTGQTQEARTFISETKEEIEKRQYLEEIETFSCLVSREAERS